MLSGQEKALGCNSLIGIVRACEGKRVQIDLRNELHIYGKVESVFGDMNVTMTNAFILTPTFKTLCGEVDQNNQTKFENPNPKFYNEITIRGRNIRFVHIPDEIDMINALQKQILAITRPNQKKKDKKQFRTRPKNKNFCNNNKPTESKIQNKENQQ
jgi:small nuclear ribonucleoprotein (snRNP)-like protein